MSEQPLLTPHHSDKLDLKNRVVMAPMTRARADNEGNVPTDLMVTYYTQRASAGLLISEGTFVSPQAVGYINVPGMYSPQQVAGWQKITDAVHAQGNLFFAQLWHVGRLSHPDMLNGNLPLAPSAINAHDKVYTPSGFLPTVTPAAMTVVQIKQAVADFAQAARNALAAGFDGVELHAANAYLFHQFFAQCANTRTDEYGGSRENRARFLFEVLEAIRDAGVDLGKVGVRLNPSLDVMGGMTLDAETLPTAEYVVQRLNDYGLAYLHLMRPFTDMSQNPLGEPNIAQRFRPLYQGTLIINKDFDQEEANTIVAEGEADLVAFGKPFIANPDLVARFAQHAPLAEPDKETFYTPGPKGYTDYPALAEPVTN
jgi:N-ethylmaleimide reductase